MLYQTIATDLRHKISQGLFRPGERLPSVRLMSKQLDVSVSTVVSAYQILEQHQVIEARAKSGFYVGVKPRPRPAAPPKARSLQPARLHISDTIDEIFVNTRNAQHTHFDLALPHAKFQPSSALKAAGNKVLRQQFERTLSMSTNPGNLELRRLIALRMLNAGCLVSPEQVLITNGCQEAILLSLQSMTSPGDLVAVESPCYYGFLLALESLGLQVVNIATDPLTGLDLDALEKAATQWPLKACLCSSSFSNPTGGAMSDDSKKHLLALAKRHQFTVIEDDILGELHHQGERRSSIKSFDEHEQVIYCSSFSKSLSPGLRIGWIVAERQRASIAEQQLAMSGASASFTQLQVAEYLKSGHFDKHLARVRPAYRSNIEHALAVIAREFPTGTRASHPEGGFLIWVALPKNINALELFSLALEENICFMPGVVFGRKNFEHCLRLSFGQPWSEHVESQLTLLGTLASKLS